MSRRKIAGRMESPAANGSIMGSPGSNWGFSIVVLNEGDLVLWYDKLSFG